MDTGRTCGQCGTPIPADAPEGGLCPRCLLRAGRETSGPTRTGSPAADGFEPPTPEELAGRVPDIEVLELIGRGGMGAVYRARQVRLDRIVALKILNTRGTRGAMFAERFTREARSLARINHPNIVAVHDFGEADGLYYLVMEYVDGANLREVMRVGKLPPREALALVPQICEALQYAHEEGFVHRDIKPENVLLDRRGRVRIADFGLVKLLQPERGGSNLTGTGEIMGTPTYMAPEQIERPGEVDHRADIYSLGVVLYEMLTGELPLGRFGPPSSRVTVDVRLDEIVLRTLEKDPARRYQHASDVQVEIASIGERPGEPGQPGPPGQHPAAGKDAASPGALAATGPTRTVLVRRPRGVTWVAVWALLLCVEAVGPFPGHPWVPGARQMWPGYLFFLGAPWVAWALSLGALVTGLGLLGLQRWARPGAIALALIAVQFYFPVGTIVSILVLVYLFRTEVRRVFELGEGPATVPEWEASRLERLMGKPPRPGDAG